MYGSSLNHEYGARGISYLVFAAIVGTVLGISVWAAFKEPLSLMTIPVCLAALGFAFLWLSRFRLVITPDAITYSCLFGTERTIRREDITAAGFAPRTSGFESPFTFLVRSGSGGELRINTRVFSRAAVRELCTLVT
jgi:hypothetical protein